MNARVVLPALLAALAVSPALAERQAPPAPGTPKGFSVPTPETFTLDNGLAVTLVPYGTVPKAEVRLSVRTGNVDEKAGEVWLADLTGALMQEGTASRTANEVAEQAARMGGELEVNVGEDLVEIGGDVLSESAAEMIALIADVVRRPRLPASELERLKGDLIRNLSIIRSQPQAMANEKFRAVLYGDHPYGRIHPTEEMLRGYTLEQARDFHARSFGAGRSRLYVVGRFDSAAVREAVRAAFGDWARGTPAAPPRPAPRSERSVWLIDRPGAVQSTIYLGLPVADPSSADWLPLVVTNTLLGGSFSSRITSNIREQKGYTYSPSGQLSNRARDTYWVEIADVTTAVTGPAIREILAEIDRLQAEPPTAQELRGFQNYRAGVFVLQNSARSGIIGQLGFVDLNGLPADWLNRYVDRVYAVTPAEVQALTKRWIDDERATIVVVGDRAQVAPQLEGLGPLK
jgi:predicted Zn-dependent peptidase